MNTKEISQVNQHLPPDLLRAIFAGIIVVALVFGVQFVGVYLRDEPQRDKKQTAGEILAESFRLSAQNRWENIFPHQLSAGDRELYANIFQMQERERWRQASRLLSLVENPLLQGHVLAQRYLHPRYRSSYAELAAWLESYGDLPQSYSIYKLALRKRQKGDVLPLPAAVKKRNILSGYGDSHASKRYQSGSRAGKLWNMGIKEWQGGNYAKAATHFARLAAMSQLPDWDIAAANYWIWRAKTKLGENSKARKYLVKASRYELSFYGMLALQELGHDITKKEKDDPDSATGNTRSLLEIPAVRRSIALAEAGRHDLAEQELRIAFVAAAQDVRRQMLSLAKHLQLPSIQIPMAKWLGKPAGNSHSRSGNNNNSINGDMDNGNTDLDSSLYPNPRWVPRDGFTVDPALLYAIVRQESGFNHRATSPAGARGLMQLMPATAHYVAKRVGLDDVITANPSRLYDPEFNLTLGQHYLRYLMNKDYVGNNLVFLTVAYNAGPGNLIKWQKDSRYANDPLLFIETIPFAETRHYVMQILANYWMYSAMLNGNNSSLHAMAEGEWPEYHGISDIAIILKR